MVYITAQCKGKSEAHINHHLHTAIHEHEEYSKCLKLQLYTTAKQSVRKPIPFHCSLVHQKLHDKLSQAGYAQVM